MRDVETSKDGHVNLKAKGLRRKAFNPEELPRFLEEFNTPKPEKSYQSMVRKTLKDQGFGDFKKATALFEYSRSKDFGYLLITEFDGVRPKKLGPALDKVLSEMKGIKGLIIDIRLNPGALISASTRSPVALPTRSGWGIFVNPNANRVRAMMVLVN